MTDGELVRQTRAGQTQAYAELVRRWSGRIVALCHAKTGRADVGEDLAQEALLRGFRALGTLADPEKFGSWLHGIAVRACLDWLKARERSTVPFSALSGDSTPEEYLAREAVAPEADFERREEAGRLLQEVEGLPEPLREVLMLYYYQDVTYQDLAQFLGVSSATINARLTKARAMLRERLNRGVPSRR